MPGFNKTLLLNGLNIGSTLCDIYIGVPDILLKCIMLELLLNTAVLFAAFLFTAFACQAVGTRFYIRHPQPSVAVTHRTPLA
jgi:hypothetical protein